MDLLIKDMSRTLKTIATDVASIKKDVASIKSDVSSIKNDVASINTILASMTARDVKQTYIVDRNQNKRQLPCRKLDGICDTFESIPISS